MKLQEHVRKHSTQNDAKLKRICKPLEKHFGVDMFFYFAIDNRGLFHTLCNQGGLSEEFFANSLFKGHPMFRHPDLITPAPFILNYQVNTYEDEKFKRSYKEQIEKYPVKKNFFLVEKSPTGFQAYGFTSAHPVDNFENRCFNNLALLNEFVRFFHREAQGFIHHVKEDPVEIASLCGASFHAAPKEQHARLSCDKKSDFFHNIGKKIPELTCREKECLYWFMRRRSARQIAEILFLSVRTVENHMWNAKNKLNCLTMAEAFDLLELLSIS